MKIDPHHFNAESDLIESLLNHDSSIIPSSSKIDSLLDEFVGELTLLKSILPGIDETDCHPENEIRLIEILLYDNSSPRPSEEFVSDNSDADIESFSPSPIPIEDSDYLMEEMDLSNGYDKNGTNRSKNGQNRARNEKRGKSQQPEVNKKSNPTMSKPKKSKYSVEILLFMVDYGFWTYSGDSCGNDSQSGYDCPPQFSLNYEPEPGYTQNYNSCPHDSLSFSQQYPCCDDCGVTHEPYQCQPKNHDYYDEQNSCYDSNSQIFNAHNDILNSQNKLMEQMTSMCEMVGQRIQKKQEEKQIQEDQAPNTRYWTIPAYYDDDDDYNFAITHNETIDSLIMGDEHLDTVPATESDEFIKSSVENLVPNP
nr:hypothetical protein [Tanacetum cinerariifolium]